MLIDFNRALRKAIQRNRVFSGVSNDHVNQIMESGTRQSFKDGDFIVREGQENRNLFLVVQGELRVSLGKRPAGSHLHRVTPIKLNTLGDGDCFGEYSLIDRQKASADVKAVSSGHLFRISGPDFEKMTATDDGLAKIIYKNLLGVLIERLRKKDGELDMVLVMP